MKKKLKIMNFELRIQNRPQFIILNSELGV
jgi:hypothetical protein